MKMNEFVQALQSSLENANVNFGNDADSVLSFLCSAYYEHNCADDSDDIKQAFDELYQAMNGKTLREMDVIIYPVCALCRRHQHAGFVDGLKLGFLLSCELNRE